MVLYYVAKSCVKNKKQIKQLLEICSGKCGERVIVQMIAYFMVLQKEMQKVIRLKRVLALKVEILKQLNTVISHYGLNVYNADVVDCYLQKAVQTKSEQLLLNLQKKLIIKYYALLSKLSSEQDKAIICNIIKSSIEIKCELDKVFMLSKN